MLIDLKVPSLAYERYWLIILKVLECENEISQRIEPIKLLREMESFVYLPCLLPELWLSKFHK